MGVGDREAPEGGFRSGRGSREGRVLGPYKARGGGNHPGAEEPGAPSPEAAQRQRLRPAPFRRGLLPLRPLFLCLPLVFLYPVFPLLSPPPPFPNKQ